MPDIKIRPYASSDFEAIAGIHDASRRAELSMASLEDAFLPFPLLRKGRISSIILTLTWRS